MAYGKGNLKGELKGGVATITNADTNPYSDLLINVSGEGTIVGCSILSGAIFIEVDTQDFILIDSTEIGKYEINYKTGYKIYGDTALRAVAITQKDIDETVTIVTANGTTSALGTLILSETGVGEITFFQEGINTSLVVDGNTVFNSYGYGNEVFTSLKYYQSFEYRTNLASPQIIYNKIS